MLNLNAVDKLNLHVVCDNSVKAGVRGILGEHGFSAVLSAGGESILFDTGQTGMVAVNNLRVMKIAPPSTIVLSHGHYDHSGGLLKYSMVCPKPCVVYTQKNAFAKRLKKVGDDLHDIGMPFGRGELTDAGYEVFESNAPQRVSGWLATSGVIERNSFEEPETEFFISEGGVDVKDPFLDDASVAAVVKGKGLVIVTGCAHAGVINTVRHFRKMLCEERIYAIVGGFHLVDASDAKMAKTIAALEELDPAYILPGHCTGKDAAYRLKEAFGGRVIFSEVGLKKAF